MSGKSVATVLPHQLKCSDDDGELELGCQEKSFKCPNKCRCSKGVVDCRSLGLKTVPEAIPFDTVELRLEKNHLESIPPNAFASAPSLKRIDLSRNRISSLAPNAFRTNRQLTTLILYDNALEDVPAGLLTGLTDLHMILMNKNKISCLPPHAFKDQRSLVLLSLFDNNLESLPPDLFQPLRSLVTLHLGQNPWNCGCHLASLSSHLAARNLETSGAVCKNPPRAAGRPLNLAPLEPCTGPLTYQEFCGIKQECPEACKCSDESVDCSGGELTSLPQLPSATKELVLDSNRIHNLHTICHQLPALRKLSLKRNQLSLIEEGTFRACANLEYLDLSENELALLEARSLTGLRQLKHLDLDKNNIVCIEEGAFHDLKRLKRLEISTRFLFCSCTNQWLSAWLNANPVSSVGFPCSSPCPGEVKSCMSDSCPANCKCKEGLVRCGGAELEQVPQQVSPLTRHLYLDSNKITEIQPGPLKSLLRLKLLDLSNNQIKYLDQNSFPFLPELETLLLSFNRIQCITPGSFKGLGSLKILSLHDNNLSSLSRDTFASINKITQLAISSNPLDCDCRLSWLAEWIQKEVEPGTATCASPSSLRDRPLLHLTPYQLTCRGSQADQPGGKCDPCYSSPCLNGGFCITEDNAIRPGLSRSFRCECTPSYHGDRCQHVVDSCYGDPCRNGGTCTPITKGKFKCTCAAGWRGRICDEDACMTRSGRSDCDCRLERGELYCRPRPEDSCRGHLCQNEGACVAGTGPSNYSCSCLHPYSGQYCEEGPDIAMMYQSTSPCSHHDCKHGHCQEVAGQPGYSCVCHSGYSGQRCEYLTGIHLTRHDSYLELEPLHTSRPVNLSLVVQTDQQTGVILYHGDRSHLAVELFHGRIRASLNIGNQPASTMFSYALLNDNSEHRLELVLDGKVLSMTIDGAAPRSIINEGSVTSLQLQQPTYLGGVPAHVGESALSRWHLRNASSLQGCVKEFHLDGKRIDFLQAARRRQGVMPGCPARQSSITESKSHNLIFPTSQDESGGENRNGCKENKCRDAGTRKCINKGARDYVCKCKKGWDGRYCERAPTCRKRKEKLVMEENNCRARKAVTVKSCRGDCHEGSTCCSVKKFKQRKIGMICNDGTRYVKVVTSATSCSCQTKKSCSRLKHPK